MSTRIMKKKMPYLDQFQTIDDAFNYLVKELNATRISSSETTQSELGSHDVKTVSFVHPGGPTAIVSVTVSHSLGVVPSAVLYGGQVHAIDIFDGNPIVWRVSSMSSTNVTIEMRVVSGTKTHNFFILK